MWKRPGYCLLYTGSVYLLCGCKSTSGIILLVMGAYVLGICVEYWLNLFEKESK